MAFLFSGHENYFIEVFPLGLYVVAFFKEFVVI